MRYKSRSYTLRHWRRPAFRPYSACLLKCFNRLPRVSSSLIMLLVGAYRACQLKVWFSCHLSNPLLSVKTSKPARPYRHCGLSGMQFAAFCIAKRYVLCCKGRLLYCRRRRFAAAKAVIFARKCRFQGPEQPCFSLILAVFVAHISRFSA